MTPEGVVIAPTTSMMYLGSTLWTDGNVHSELNRRLGMAWADFNKLTRLWSHTSIPRRRKVEVFQATIMTGLMYGLSTLWLNVGDQRRLDCFQARCLRRCLGIKPSFLSRVSNQTVLREAAQMPSTRHLLKQQLLLYGKVARAPEDDPLRQLTFCPESLQPATSRYVSKRGRPKSEKATKVELEAAKIARGERLKPLVMNESAWI